MPVKYDAFSDLLKKKFYFDKLYRVEDVARKIGVSPSTLYNWIGGEAHTPVDVLALLYNATGDIGFLNFTLNDTDQRAVPKEAVESQRSVMDETLDAVAAHGALVQSIHAAIADRIITDNELKDIEININKVGRELEELRQAAKANNVGGRNG